MNIIGTILDYGSALDWISPTLSIMQDITNGPSYTFLIPADCGLSHREITNMLRQRGVKTWGHMIVNGTFMVTVRQSQEEFARTLLKQAGLPVDAGPESKSDGGVTKSKKRHSLGDLLREIGTIRL